MSRLLEGEFGVRVPPKSIVQTLRTLNTQGHPGPRYLGTGARDEFHAPLERRVLVCSTGREHHALYVLESFVREAAQRPWRETARARNAVLAFLGGVARASPLLVKDGDHAVLARVLQHLLPA